MAHKLHVKKFMVKVLLHENFITMLEGNIRGQWWTNGQKEKTLDIQGFSEMEHSGIEPLTSTLPA